MNTDTEKFVRELFAKLKILESEHCTTNQLYFAIYDACGEWLERKMDEEAA